jgi:hypothetical protein
VLADPDPVAVLQLRDLDVGVVEQRPVRASEVVNPKATLRELERGVSPRHRGIVEFEIDAGPPPDRDARAVERVLTTRGIPRDDHDRRLPGREVLGQAVRGSRGLDPPGSFVTHAILPPAPDTPVPMSLAAADR